MPENNSSIRRKFDILMDMNRFKLIAIIILAVIAGVVGMQTACAFQPALNDATGEFLKGNYSVAIDACTRVQQRGDRGLRAEAMHLQAMCLSKAGEYSRARELLKQALSYATGATQFELYLAIGDTYFNQEMYPQAVSMYDQLINQAGSSDYLAMLYYKAGKAYQKNGEWVKSNYYLDLLNKKFPQSMEARLAAKTSPDGDYFTIQVGSFANKQNAQKLHDDLKTRGYEAYMMPLPADGRTLYRVRVGKFVSRNSAQLIEQQLRSKESLPTKMFP